jgi:glycosyltransferase involved in cell wall biosynthesis
MRIVYAHDEPLPHTGADAEQVVNTVAALARHGVAIELLLPAARGNVPDAQQLREYFDVAGAFEVGTLPKSSLGVRVVEKWTHAIRVARDARTVSADVAYTRNLPSVFTLLRAGRRVVYEHFRPWGDQHPLLRPALRWMMRHPRFVGAVLHSAHTRDSYLRLGAPPERLIIAHNGWDPRRMEPRLSRADARQRLGLPPAGTIAVYAGRVNRKKGLEMLLAAARRMPELTLILVGSEGHDAIEIEAVTLSNVRVVPWQPFRSLAPYLYAADVLIIPPSLAPLEHGTTVLPLKLFLYLAAGRAILAPVAPDTSELLRAGENAALVPPDDVPAMLDMLRRLAADPALAERLGAAALETARELTWDLRAIRIRDFIATRLATGPD